MPIDYYDQTALVELGKPVALLGWLSTVTRRVGHRIASLAGLPVADLDRLVEHDAGCSVAQLLAEKGEPAYRRLEQCRLEATLHDRPAGILILGDGTLLDDANLSQVKGAAILVALDLDLPGLFWQVRKLSSDSAAGAWHPIWPMPERLDDLRPFYDRRHRVFEEADVHLDVRGLGPGGVARRVLEEVPDLRPVLEPWSAF